jgi:hypothetical protein
MSSTYVYSLTHYTKWEGYLEVVNYYLLLVEGILITVIHNEN